MEKAIIITAPSGAGKSTIANHVLSVIDELEFSVSATTRSPRKNEVDGEDYYFIDQEEFKQRIEDGKFIEWEEVYEGVYYGTLREEVERLWAEDKAVLFIVDVVGAADLKGYFGKLGLAVFIEPPSLDVLRQRLQKRGSETDRSLQQRIERAERELKQRDEFDLVIVNDDLAIAKMQAEDEVRHFLKNM